MQRLRSPLHPNSHPYQNTPKDIDEHFAYGDDIITSDENKIDHIKKAVLHSMN